MSDDRLKEMLIRHEGMRKFPYRCTQGFLTIGVGRNIETVGVSEFEAMLMLANDIERVKREAVDNFDWFKSLNIVRQDIVLNMLFNMGLKKFKGFRKLIKSLREQNYERAAEEMLDSLWASQVGIRAQELAQMMRLGKYL